MIEDEYPPTAFYFKVKFAGAISDTSFQDVSGIDSTIDLESYSEAGGQTYKLLAGISHSNLVLKRGIASKDSPLATWCCSVFQSEYGKRIEPIATMTLLLMNADQEPIRAWSLARVYPVKWTIDNFNSTKNQVAIETIELSYEYLERVA